MSRRIGLFIFFLLSVALVFAGQAQETPTPFDVVILNARIVDGSGETSYRGDLGIRGGRIVHIARDETLQDAPSAKRIDAAGLVVAPGFIDTHMHVESSLPRIPDAGNLVRDGVTTVVTGNCGGSATGLGNWFSELEEKGVSLNVASLVGHNTVRRAVMGNADRAPTAEELQRMVALVDKAMEEGAAGLSTGLIYLPGVYSETDEVVALARAAARHGGLYASHMRDETGEIFDAIKEAVHIGREAGMPVQISHFKIAGKLLWGRSAETLAAVEHARAEGVDVTVDQYPYAASSTGLYIFVPPWALAGGRGEFQKRAADPATRQKIVSEMMTKPARLAGWDHFGFAVVARCPWDAFLNGKSIREINQQVYERADTFEDQINTVLDMLAHDTRRIQMVYHAMSEEDVRRILAHPLTMVGRDGGAQVPGNTQIHPRSYGAAARILGRYVREEKVLPLELAVRKLATLGALRFGLKNRGMIKEGYWADITIFDPDTVIDTATFENPHQYSQGIPYVLVNGQLVVDASEQTPARPGQMLRKK